MVTATSVNILSVVSPNSSAIVSESEREEYLHHLQHDTTITMIPAMVFLLILALVGFCGNSLVLFIYSRNMKKTSTRIFILTMAAIDLLANTLSIPGEIYDMFHIWDWKDADLCRGRLFVSAFTTLSSAMQLLAIAVVRYRKVCAPHDWQITNKQATIISLVIILLGGIFSVPYGFLNGRQTKTTPRPDIFGYECTIDDRYVKTTWPLLNNGLFLFLFFGCSIPFITLYTLIAVQAFRHSQGLRKFTGKTPTGKSRPIPEREEVDSESRMYDKSIDHEKREGTTGTNIDFKNSCFKSIEINVDGSGFEETSELDKTSTSCINPASQQLPHVQDKDGKHLPTMSTASSFSCSNQTDLEEQQGKKDIGESDNCHLFNNTDPGHAGMTLEKADISSGNMEVSPKSSHGVKRGPTCTTSGQLPAPREDICSGTTGQSDFGGKGQRKTKREEKFPEPVKNSRKILGKERKMIPVSVSSTRRRSADRWMSRTTIMLLTISLIYVVGFLPYLALSLFKVLAPDKHGSMNMLEQSLYNIFLRFFFLNCAANPVVYSLCDSVFRQKCLSVFRCGPVQRQR